MQIQWYGHSCFLLTTQNGTRILTDPYDESVGYPMHTIPADIVTVSHAHFDHNYVPMAQGDYTLLQTAGKWEFPDLTITALPAFHDDAQGAKRGENLVFLFETEELRVAHLGDLGGRPPKETAKAILDLDVLFAPIGGTFTIDPQTACHIANATNANVLIPMHYQTSALKFKEPLLGVEALISIVKNCRVHRLNESECTITKSSLGEYRLLVLDYTRASEEEANA